MKRVDAPRGWYDGNAHTVFMRGHERLPVNDKGIMDGRFIRERDYRRLLAVVKAAKVCMDDNDMDNINVLCAAIAKLEST